MPTLQPGPNGLPQLQLNANNGAHAQITAHGAHLTSWVPPDGRERLFLSRASAFQPGKAIRGGVPICFPQFSDLGPLPKHGFARTLPWELLNSPQADQATFRLHDSEHTRALWPHAFETTLTVTLTEAALTLTLTVTNPDPHPFDFTAALHTYLRVADIASTQIEGLSNCTYFDQVADMPLRRQSAQPITFTGEVDRLYYQTPASVTLHDQDQTLKITQTGFTDTVIWNPWVTKGLSLSDLEPDGYKHFACIEAAIIAQPIHLEPYQTWSGSQTLHS